MTAAGAVALYWSVLLLVAIELRRELGDPGGTDATSGKRDVRLYVALAVAVVATVTLTVLRLRAGG